MKLVDLFEHPILLPIKTAINEGISHPEDLLFDQGIEGAKRAVDELSGLEKKSKSIVIKWDGFPALIFGRDSQGRLVLSDKHMFDKIDKTTGQRMGMSTSSEEFVNYDVARGADRSDLYAKEKILRPELESLIPNTPANRDKYYFGDLLWVGKLSAVDNEFTFTPNTVTYKVNKNSELGNDIANSKGGIAVHSFISGVGQPDVPLKGIRSLPKNGSIVFLSDETSEKPDIKLDSGVVSRAQTAIEKYSPTAEKCIQMIVAAKAKGILSAMKTFITFKIKEGNFENLTEDFIKYLPDKLTNDSARRNAALLLSTPDGKAGIMAIWHIWAAIVNLKTSIKQQIDLVHNDPSMPIRAFIGEDTGHEGYVIGSGSEKLKLVDRLGFSKANFAKNRTDPKDMAKRASMPVAAFCFGRMNPPTLGHKKLMDTTIGIGKENSFIFFSAKHDPKTDPLEYHTKIAFAKKMFPEHASQIVDTSVINPIFAANYLYKQGFRNITFVAGSDRLGSQSGSLERTLRQWNSSEIRSTDAVIGNREEVVLNFISSGNRDLDSTGVEGYSGTKARNAAMDNNKNDFYKFTGADDSVKVNNITLFDAVRKGMNLTPLREDAAISIINRGQLLDLEKYLNELWIRLQQSNNIRTVLTTKFSKHFIDRINDLRNVTQITIDELNKLFTKAYTKYGKTIIAMGPYSRGTIRDEITNVNIPFGLQWDRDSQSMQLVATTVKRDEREMDPKGGKEFFITEDLLPTHKDGTIALLHLTEESATELKNWCDRHGLPCLDVDELHCTLLYSRKPVEKFSKFDNATLDVPAKIIDWKKLGSALVLELYCPKAERFHDWMIKHGGTHDYPDYIAHISISYDWESEYLPKILPIMPIEFDKMSVKEINKNYTDEAES